MAYWWHVKRYGDAPVRVTEKMAAAVSEALARGDEFISVKGTTIAAKAVSGVEKSTERIGDDNIYLLAEGAAATLLPYGKGKPVLGLDYEENGITYEAGVICNWYKKNIDRREWESYYSKSPSYHRIDEAGECWVAMLLPEETGSTKPDYLVLCTKEEAEHLDAIRANI